MKLAAIRPGKSVVFSEKKRGMPTGRVNCSFSSGDAAGAFLSLALVKALTRRRRYYVVAVAFGALVSLGRVSSGAHFFSDTVVSFFIMLFVTDIFWHYVVANRYEPASD